MSEKGQGQRAAGVSASGAGQGNRGHTPEAPPPKPSAPTDQGGQRPAPPPGGGGGGGARPPNRQPISGGVQFEDGSRLVQDEQGAVRYTDPQGRTGLWKGGDTWVDEATGQPMPGDFVPKTPGDKIPRLS